MTKYFALSFLSLGAILILNSGDVTGIDVHPLMLLRTSGNALQRPYDLVIEGENRFKKYNFTAGTNEHEIRLLFCGKGTYENQRQLIEAQQNATKMDIQTDIVSEYCLFEMEPSVMSNFQGRVTSINLHRCKVEPEPLISRILSDENTEAIRCGPEDKGSLYRYGYQIWLKEELFDQVKDNLGSSLTKSKVYPYNKIIDYEIFRICYDIKKKQVLHTQHRVISPKLLREPYLTQELKKEYPLGEDNFDLEELNFHERFNKYKDYFSDVGSSTTQQKSYRMYQFVPETDFSFSLWQKPTSHIVNRDLINEKLHYLWEGITITCKNYAVQNEVELDVYTKTFNMHGELTLVPQIWSKVIHLNKRAVAIFANNEMDENLNGVISQTYCNNIDYCKNLNSGALTFNPDVQQYIKCCAINEETKKLFNFNPSLNIEGVLMIPGLNV